MPSDKIIEVIAVHLHRCQMIEQILKLTSSTFYINLGDNRMCKDVNSIYTNYGTDMIRKSQKLALHTT